MDKITVPLKSKFLKLKAKSYFLVFIFVVLSTLSGCNENTQKEIENAIGSEVQKELDNLAESAKEEISKAVDEVKNDIGKQVDDWLSGIIKQAGNLFDSIKPKPKHGKLIFMQHGLNDNYKCFEVMVNQLTKNNNYISLGYVTFGLHGSTIVYEDEFKVKLQSYFGLKATNTPNDYLSETINRLTDEGFNVLVRIGFSSGNLSFDTQLTQMSNMVEKFGEHNADVVFIGHSMGGLISINYGIDYADNHPENVTIITISTPYTPNFYAMEVWNGTLQGKFGSWWTKQEKGYAHRDLGGFSDENDDNALENLKNKWITYKNEGGTAKLYTIAVGYKKHKNDTGSGTKRGDGIVELYSQRGADWGYVFKEYIIDTGKEISVTDTKDDCFHSNTPKLSSVVKEVKKIIK